LVMWLHHSNTILDRAVIEHNALSVSRMYTSVSFTQMAALLNVTPAQAETVVARMIREDRMKAKIDQVEQMIILDDQDEMMKFDTYTSQIADAIGAVATTVATKYPSLVH